MKNHPKASEYLGMSGKSLALKIVLDAVAWGYVAMAFGTGTSCRKRKHRNVREPPGRYRSII